MIDNVVITTNVSVLLLVRPRASDAMTVTWVFPTELNVARSREPSLMYPPAGRFAELYENGGIPEVTLK